MKKLFTFLGVILVMAGSATRAQEVNSSAPLQGSVSTADATLEDGEDWIPSISLDSRYGYDRVVGGDAAGFGGDGFYLYIDGKISKHFSYSLCQRFFSANGEDDSVFDNTDWLTLSYHLGDFTFTAGKESMYIGSYEIAADDIDSYYDLNSMFYNSLSTYQWGASAMWTSKSENTSVVFQFANSPFSYAPKQDNMYSYNLAWMSQSDYHDATWSVNLVEYEPGEYVKIIALGQTFYIGSFSLSLDYIERSASWRSKLGEDFTLSVMPAVTFADEKVRLFGKFGWEKCKDDLEYDFLGEYLTKEEMIAANEECGTTLPAFKIGGEDYLYYGAGVEYCPIESVRLHAVWGSNNYTSRHTINIGATWRFDITNAIRRIAGKCN